MMTPLRQFVCDTCQQVIEKREDGWLEWIHDTNKRHIHSFRIVHHLQRSPLGGRKGCYQHEDAPGRADYHLDDIFTILIPEMLSHLDVGMYHDPDKTGATVSDIRNYVETFRRLTIPYYEEARLYWAQAIKNGDFEGENELTIFSESVLQKVIRKYSVA